MTKLIKPENSFESNSEERLYQELMSQYSQTKDRNDAYITRSQNLLGFAGIVNTILVALTVAMVSNKEVTAFLKLSPNLPYFRFTILIGFLGYILSIILSLAAFRTTKYKPIPQINSKDFINDVFQKKVNLSLRHLSMQAYEGIRYYDEKNAEKYTFLFLATTFLIVAIISTATLGILILITI